MTSFKPGDLVLIRFPFSSLEGGKKRPALVLRDTFHSRNVHLVTVAMVTSQLDGLKLEGDLVVHEWEGAGLLHPSLIRLAKVATLDIEMVERRLGSLRAQDVSRAKLVFRKLYREWV